MKLMERNAVLIALLVIFPSSLRSQTADRDSKDPMIIRGQVLVKGQNTPTNSFVEARHDGAVISKADVNTKLDISSFVLSIEEQGKVTEGSVINLRIGGATEPGGIVWHEGKSVKRNILVETTIRKEAVIKNASAIEGKDRWNLECEFDPVRQNDLPPESIQYRIRWYYTPPDNPITKDIDESLEPIRIAENTVLHSQTKPSVAIHPGKIPALMQFLRIVITPVLNNGEFGPSAIKKVRTQFKKPY